MQHHGIGRGVEAGNRADGGARRIRAMHAGHGDGTLPRLAVIDGDNAPAINAPGHFMFVLTSRDAGIAFDAAFRVQQEFHAGHVSGPPLCRADLTKRDLGFLHEGNRVIAIGGHCIDAFAKHDRVRA